MPVKNVGVPVSKSQKVWLASFCLHKSSPRSSLLPSSPAHSILFLIIAADLESLKSHYWYRALRILQLAFFHYSFLWVSSHF